MALQLPSWIPSIVVRQQRPKTWLLSIYLPMARPTTPEGDMTYKIKIDFEMKMLILPVLNFWDRSFRVDLDLIWTLILYWYCVDVTIQSVLLVSTSDFAILLI